MCEYQVTRAFKTNEDFETLAQENFPGCDEFDEELRIKMKLQTNMKAQTQLNPMKSWLVVEETFKELRDCIFRDIFGISQETEEGFGEKAKVQPESDALRCDAILKDMPNIEGKHCQTAPKNIQTELSNSKISDETNLYTQNVPDGQYSQLLHRFIDHNLETINLQNKLMQLGVPGFERVLASRKNLNEFWKDPSIESQKDEVNSEDMLAMENHEIDGQAGTLASMIDSKGKEARDSVLEASGEKGLVLEKKQIEWVSQGLRKLEQENKKLKKANKKLKKANKKHRVQKKHQSVKNIQLAKKKERLLREKEQFENENQNLKKQLMNEREQTKKVLENNEGLREELEKVKLEKEQQANQYLGQRASWLNEKDKHLNERTKDTRQREEMSSELEKLRKEKETMRAKIDELNRKCNGLFLQNFEQVQRLQQLELQAVNGSNYFAMELEWSQQQILLQKDRQIGLLSNLINRLFQNFDAITRRTEVVALPEL